MLRKIHMGALATVVLAATLPVQATIIVDDFSNILPNNPSAIPVGTVLQIRNPTPALSTATQSSLSGVLGGDRYAELSAAVGLTGTVNGEVIPNFAGPGANVYGVFANIGGKFTSTLEYGQSTDLNLNAAGELGLQIFLSETDQNANITVTLTSARGTGSQATASSTKLMPGFTFDTPYLYAKSEFPGVDFSQIDDIKVKIDGSTQPSGGLDLYIYAVQFVPEPGSLTLLAVGGLALLRRRS